MKCNHAVLALAGVLLASGATVQGDEGVVSTVEACQTALRGVNKVRIEKKQLGRTAIRRACEKVAKIEDVDLREETIDCLVKVATLKGDWTTSTPLIQSCVVKHPTCSPKVAKAKPRYASPEIREACNDPSFVRTRCMVNTIADALQERPWKVSIYKQVCAKAKEVQCSDMDRKRLVYIGGKFEDDPSVGDSDLDYICEVELARNNGKARNTWRAKYIAKACSAKDKCCVMSEARDHQVAVNISLAEGGYVSALGPVELRNRCN